MKTGDDIPLMETLKSLKKMRREEEKKKKVIDSEEDSEEDSEDDSEEFSQKSGEDYDWDGFPEFLCPEEGTESEEDIIHESDRRELDRGFNFVLRNGRTVTKPRRPLKTYIPRSSKHCNSVLYNLNYPLVALTKMALDRYNDIRGTSYEYVGLVKAYKTVVGGFEFTIRFKACLKDQRPIDFQAIVYKATPEKTKSAKKRRNCDVRIKFVYPLQAPHLPKEFGIAAASLINSAARWVVQAGMKPLEDCSLLV